MMRYLVWGPSGVALHDTVISRAETFASIRVATRLKLIVFLPLWSFSASRPSLKFRSVVRTPLLYARGGIIPYSTAQLISN